MDGPFSTESPGLVPLSNPPIVRTIAQIRFPSFSSFAADPDGVAKKFAVALEKDYPRFNAGHEVAIVLSPDGVTQQPGGTPLWRLVSADNTWQVSLGPTFLSLDTSAYIRRSDFVARLVAAWAAFVEIAAPPVIERVGLRYVNRVVEADHLAKLPKMVRPEVLGLAATSGGAELRSSLSESNFAIDTGEEFQARWGLAPANFTPDALVAPVATQSWILDLDAYQACGPNGCPVADMDLDELASQLALRAYQFYRWATTDEWLRTFGGDV